MVHKSCPLSNAFFGLKNDVLCSQNPGDAINIDQNDRSTKGLHDASSQFFRKRMHVQLWGVWKSVRTTGRHLIKLVLYHMPKWPASYSQTRGCDHPIRAVWRCCNELDGIRVHL